MTEIKGGSNLGANAETIASKAGNHWILNGDKYFASNVGAELAIVAARPKGARKVRKASRFFLCRVIAKTGKYDCPIGFTPQN